MKYYVYIYLNPLKPGYYQYKKFKFDYEPFYIGIGKGNRINVHVNKAKCNIKKSLKDNIILKIINNNLEPIRFKLYENITLESAKRLEILLIKLIGRRNLGKGTLSNLTDGGDGTVGHTMTDEMKEKFKHMMKNRWMKGEFDHVDHHRFGEDNGFYNKKHSDETKNKIRETIGDRRIGEKNANFGNKWTDEMKKEASMRSIETHKHLTGDNNPAKREDVRKKISETKMGALNPNAKKWLLISPDNVKHIIEGGIKRNLKLFGLDYQSFKIKDDIRTNTKGWKLKEI